MIRCRVAVTLLSLVLLSLGPMAVFGQSGTETKSDGEELRELKAEIMAVRRELQEIKTLLRQGQGPIPSPTGQDVVLRIEPQRVKGNRNARVTIVEFSDFECPYCRKFAEETLAQIDRDYVQTGKVRYAFRNYPIGALHKDAFKAAEAAGCAQAQGRFWEMHAHLFEHQKALDEQDLHAHAKAVGLDVDKFRECLGSGRQGDEVRKDIAEALRARVRGTPTFFLGLTDPNSPEVKPVDVIMGAQPYLAFKMAIERLLAVKEPAR